MESFQITLKWNPFLANGKDKGAHNFITKLSVQLHKAAVHDSHHSSVIKNLMVLKHTLHSTWNNFSPTRSMITNATLINPQYKRTANCQYIEKTE